MTPEEARQAKQLGIERTTEKWIRDVEEQWRKALEMGRDYAIISTLNQQVTEVQKRVAGHFESLGYTFREEKYFGGEYRDYILRLTPPAPREPGLIRQLITRLFGGTHA